MAQTDNHRRCNYVASLDEEYFDPEAPMHVPVRHCHDIPECSRGKDACLQVTRVEEGWWYKCHRCGIKGFRPVRGLSPDQLKKWIVSKSVPRQKQTDVVLPPDFDTNLSAYPKAMAWLMLLGITDEQIKAYKLGYSRYFDRLIFPVYMRGKLVFWIGRSFKPETKECPKWLSVRSSRNDGVWFSAHGPKGCKKIVLVEDILSALKVSNVCHAVAVLGVYIPDTLMWKIKASGHEVVVWLDRDKTERTLAYFHRFRAAGIPAKMKSTNLDPKKFTVKQLEEMLS